MKDSTQLFNTPSEEMATSFLGKKFFDILLIIGFIIISLFISQRIYFINSLFNNFDFFNLTIIILAIFRLTKMFVSDSILQWFRDLFLVVKTEKIDDKIKITRKLPNNGLRREIALLLDCPWCLTLWLSLITFYIWFSCEQSRFIFFILSLSGITSIIYLGIKNLQLSLEKKMK